MLNSLQSSGATLSQRTAVTRIRPLRLGFIVRQDTNWETMSHIIKYNCSIWGGKFNLLVPTDGETIREDWWRILLSHDPDTLFLVGEISDELTTQLCNRLLPMQIFTWDNNAVEELFEDTHINPVLIGSVLLQNLSTHREVSDSNLRYPIIESGPYAAYLEMLCGSYFQSPDIDYAEAIRNHLGACDIACSPETLEEYLNLVSELRQWLLPFDISGLQVNPFYHGFPFTDYALIVSNGSIDDLMLFHAWRWAFTMRRGKTSVCIVPYEQLRSDKNIQTLANWYSANVSSNSFAIASLSIPLEELIMFRDRLKSHLPKHSDGWGVDIIRCNFNIPVPSVPHSKRTQIVTVEGDRLSFELPHPNFEKHILRRRRWVCEIELSPGAGNRQGFKPSMFRDLNDLLSGADPEHPMNQRLVSMAGGYLIRIARGDLAMRVTSDNHIGVLHLPSARNLIHSALECAGYSVTQERTAYYQGMINLIGGIGEVNFLQNESLLDLFSNGDLIRGKALEVRQMFKTFQVGSKTECSKFVDRLQPLANHRVLLRGYILQCPTCGLPAWYDISIVDESVTCQGCLNDFQLPMRLVFAYKLNELFLDRHNQGTIAVLMTLYLLYNTIRHSLIWQADISLRRNDQDAEVDLICMCDGLLVLAECKNSFRKDEDIEDIIEQLEREIPVAVAMNANLFLFATLQDDIPSEITEFIQRNKKEHPQLAVRLVTRQELLRGKFIAEEETESNKEVSLHRLVKTPPRHEGNDCFDIDPNQPQKITWSF